MIKHITGINFYKQRYNNTHIAFGSNNDKISDNSNNSILSNACMAIAVSSLAGLLMSIPGHNKSENEIEINEYQQQIETKVPLFVKELNEIISQKQIEKLYSKVDSIIQANISEKDKVNLIRREINNTVKKTCVLLTSKLPEERKKNIEFLKKHTLFVAKIMTDEQLSMDDKIPIIADRMGVNKMDEKKEKAIILLSIVGLLLGISLGVYLGSGANGIMGMAVMSAFFGFAGKYIGEEAAKELFTFTKHAFSAEYKKQLQYNLNDNIQRGLYKPLSKEIRKNENNIKLTFENDENEEINIIQDTE